MTDPTYAEQPDPWSDKPLYVVVGRKGDWRRAGFGAFVVQQPHANDDLESAERQAANLQRDAIQRGRPHDRYRVAELRFLVEEPLQAEIEETR